MKTISVLGIDLAKNVFQVHGVDAEGAVVTRRKLSRKGLKAFTAKLSPCLIGMEATGGARYWVRELQAQGHDARLMAPQFVKPFVKSCKNDRNDAEAICEAVQRPTMRFVGYKTREQQGIQLLHRVRSGEISRRTELCNEIRGILHGVGFTAPMGLTRLRERTKELLSSESLERWEQRLVQKMLNEWTTLDGFIEESDQALKEVFTEHKAVCERLTTIPGVGPITATAILSTVGDIRNFKSGRHLSAWLGLVPRQNSSGGKNQLGGITKRGDTYLRTLLIHGGRSVVKYAKNRSDRRSLWIAGKIQTRGKNKAAVAVANKNARVIWKILTTDERYKEF